MSIAYVIVPSSKRERLRDGVVVEAIEEAHEVACDELSRVGVFTNLGNLILLVVIPGCCYEAFPFQHQPRVVAANWHWDFIPIIVGLTPIACAPARVQIVDGAVFLVKPLMELAAGFIVIRHQGVAVFVVNLPAHHVRIVSKTQGELLCDFSAELAVDGRRRRSVRAIAMRYALAIRFSAENFRMLLRKPCRGSSRWSSYDTDDMVLGGSSNRALQPIEVVVSFGRLIAAPRKLGDAHDFDIGGLHQAEIFVPPRLRPLLRIPSCPE